MLKDALKKYKIEDLFEDNDEPCVIPTRNHTKVSTDRNKGGTVVSGGSLVGSTSTTGTRTLTLLMKYSGLPFHLEK